MEQEYREQHPESQLFHPFPLLPGNHAAAPEGPAEGDDQENRKEAFEYGDHQRSGSARSVSPAVTGTVPGRAGAIPVRVTVAVPGAVAAVDPVCRSGRDGFKSKSPVSGLRVVDRPAIGGDKPMMALQYHRRMRAS